MEYKTKQPTNLSMLQRFGRWLGLKQYQIEVTFGVYMFTPTEKFIFWSAVFLLSALMTIAVILYLPQHILFIISRAWFYVNGGDPQPNDVAAGIADLKDSASATLASAASAAAATASKAAESMGSRVQEL
ncbi:hypothetical protein F4780DRAFT_775818 [Xylariomycetidae sp. FL0641]|nr:hypothetical protein F4780DRAFT_775818 [Xylariomycetidae sp. FL0641]